MEPQRQESEECLENTRLIAAARELWLGAVTSCGREEHNRNSDVTVASLGWDAVNLPLSHLGWGPYNRAC